MRDVNNSLGCSIYSHPGLIEVTAHEKGENASTLSSEKKNAYMKIGKDRMMAMHFLMGADKIKYDDIITSYKNMYLMNKRKNYPETLHDAFVLMKGWATTVNQSYHKVGVAFNTMGVVSIVSHGDEFNPNLMRGLVDGGLSLGQMHRVELLGNFLFFSSDTYFYMM